MSRKGSILAAETKLAVQHAQPSGASFKLRRVRDRVGWKRMRRYRKFSPNN
ncbi:hypothetical protein BRCON_2727 [Candidatus Sumerlaea chitinivorans]|uniref:Uncharacterized protein n=1 Tax=Sumerlaea chitinivorans TaxID=2250252 RepID=A0A2Z4Y9A1_SUMC1|nr:hypothetical protein BRCON_2727 [Candidatus Sumerlaea chitinivorans]